MAEQPDQISQILGRINRQLLDFDRSYRGASALVDPALVKDAQRKIEIIWEDWKKLKDLPNAQAANDVVSTGMRLKSSLEQLDDLERRTDQSTFSRWDPRNWIGDTQSKTQAKFDQVVARVDTVRNSPFVGPDGKATLPAPSNIAPSLATGARPVDNPALVFGQMDKLALVKGQTTTDFYKTAQSDYRKADLSAAKRLSSHRERGLDKTLKPDHVRQASFKDTMGTERRSTIEAGKAATNQMNGALAKASAIFGRDRVQQISQIQESFINTTDPRDPKFQEKLAEVGKKVAKVLERDQGHHQYKSERANTIVNDRVWNLLWGARMGGMGIVDRNATITPNEEALARAAKLKEMDAQMGTLARTDRGGNAFTPGVRIQSDSQQTV